ncbi:hypothetical protein Pan216_29090 [Planctomycetes bacterium Pan216]|uniref:Uncharacterized protein n=1 Tax=Kolteria novifilia TaxID=2527975 RepID=A0A518B4Z2_9BACT|nr:hypothetical protein Pan216_29090 [Planctomycetes bacterium Pan216]
MNEFPEHSLPGSIARESKEPILLLAVEAFDRIAQAAFGVLLGERRKGIVDAGGPTLFMERIEDRLLVERRPLETFDNDIVKPKNSPVGVPMGKPFGLAGERQDSTGSGRDLIGKVDAFRGSPLESAVIVMREAASYFGEHKTGPFGKRQVTRTTKDATLMSVGGYFTLVFDHSSTYEQAKLVSREPSSKQFLEFDSEIPPIGARLFRVAGRFTKQR